MKTFKLSMLILLLAIGSSCSKEVEGPQGSQGEQGEQGPQGEQGEQGEEGNANVIGTNEVTLQSSAWTQSGDSWFADLNVPGIDQNIVNTGLVQVFIKYGSQWWALPDQSGVNQTTYGYSLGEVALMNQNVNGTTATQPTVNTFRVVIISSSNLQENPNTDWTDYEKVEQILNL